MTKKITLIFYFLFLAISFHARAQEELFELINNPSIIRKTATASTGLRSSESYFKNPYFIVDTIALPFIDDFSTNKLLSDDIRLYPSWAITDSIAYSFTVNGMMLDSIKYMLDTSWTYTYNTGTNKYDSSANTSIIITKYENPLEPFIPTSIITVWPTYSMPVFDTAGVFLTYEKVVPDVNLYLKTDTIKVIRASAGNAIWTDQNVFINNSYPVNPPTIGVATFDGLKLNGKPYDPNKPQSQGAADTLTSKPINLEYQASDSIYLSFYFQPQGIGNAPEKEDMLMLEFYSPLDSSWYLQWNAEGSSIIDFQQAMILINDTKFLKNGFKFRFVNFATLSGNLDHWHLDYVKINKNRSLADTLPNDVAFVRPNRVLLDKYQEMPWRQFIANPEGEMYQTLQVDMRNNSSSSKVVTYTYDIRDKNDKLLLTNSGLNGNEQSNTSFTYSNKLDFVFPNSSELYENFQVLNTIVVPITGDEVKSNDTIKQFQKFDHHYAYDDGSAEAAYGLSANGGKMAYSFFLNTPDTLSAVAIHFAQVNQDVSFYNFKLTVWSSLSPETIIYQSEEFENPIYENLINGYHVYKISPLLLPAGIFYVGMVQSNSERLNVGFDKNNDASAQMNFNISGQWETTQFNGSWMIRPVLGTSALPIGIKTHQLATKNKNDVFESVNFHPNPSSGFLAIDGIPSETSYSLQAFDLFGKEMTIFTKRDNKLFDFTALASGIYIIKLIDTESGFSKQFKVIITK